MPFNMTSSDTKCGTCRYWTGTRHSAQGGKAVEVESPSARGSCAERTTGGRSMSANQTCSKFAKWENLRVRNA